MILILGDIHGEWGALNQLINRYKDLVDYIICCGDFGYWPNFWGTQLTHPYDPAKPDKGILFQGGKFKILFCDGNHEDHWSLKQLEDNEIVPNVFYMKRGSTYRLPDGRNILFMGGANSIDKHMRKIGVDWFPEETISHGDMQNLPDEKVDILITHTCSEDILSDMCDGKIYDNDPSRAAVSYIVNKYKPDLWYFGHWHMYKEGIYKNTKWTALSMPNRTGWWKILP